MATQREQSRQEWTGNNTREDIDSGSLQRIADATELMARNYLELQNDMIFWKNRAEKGLARAEAAERRITALKGVITKMKKRK